MERNVFTFWLPFILLLRLFFNLSIVELRKKPGNCLKKEKSQQLNVQIYIWLAHLFPVH